MQQVLVGGNMIEILTSGNAEKDIQDFLNVLIQKYNIKRADEFLEEFFDFVSRVSKEEYSDSEKMAKITQENPEEISKITEEFFSLIEKYTEGFDFEEGRQEEMKLIKKKIEE
jgi:hypothetical protein